MTIDDKNRDEKLQYDIKREAAKISALSLDKIDKYEFLTVEETLLSDQSRTIEQAKFTFFPLSIAFQKQIKTIEDQGIQQAGALKALKPEEKQELESIEDIFPKTTRTNEIKTKMSLRGIKSIYYKIWQNFLTNLH